MTMKIMAAAAIVAGALAAAGGIALAAQDKYSVTSPHGIAFAEFRGFEDWPAVAVSHAEDLKLIEVIVGNPAMIAAYRAGIPENGQPVPDGARMAKIHWNPKQSTTAPTDTTVPGTLHDIDFMVKDSKRFAATGGWGYAQFNYDTATDTFTPLEDDPGCGYACHTLVKTNDYVFTAYGKR
jgi:Cytochrome P460